MPAVQWTQGEGKDCWIYCPVVLGYTYAAVSPLNITLSAERQVFMGFARWYELAPPFRWCQSVLFGNVTVTGVCVLTSYESSMTTVNIHTADFHKVINVDDASGLGLQ